MASGRLIARAGWILLGGALLVLVLAALYLAADAEGLGAAYARYYPYVFIAAAAALLLLGGAIVQRLRGLRRALREGQPGARLNRRLLALLLALALPPVLLVYGFSARFIGATVDSWLRANSAEILGDALALGRAFLDERRQQAERDVQALALVLGGLPESLWQDEIDAALDRLGARQVAVFAADGRLLALAAADPSLVAADPPPDELRLVAASSGGAVTVEPAGELLVVRALQRVEGGLETAYVQVLGGLPPSYSSGLMRVEQGLAQARQATFLRDSLKLVFVLILSFVLLLSVLLAILLAFVLSRRLVAPIGRLAAATRQVSEGDYTVSLPEAGDDELGFLVRGFNHMLRELDAASARARSSQAETERQRAFLETVLGRLSAGVLVLGEDASVRSANPAAARLCATPAVLQPGIGFAALRGAQPALAPLLDLAAQRLAEDSLEFREELAIDMPEGRQLWLLRGARLADRSLLLVVDDTTAIDRARRDAAWGEVARRLAHEVKNPLTPIQLAAERLRRRVLPRLAAEDAEVLDRATHTIVAQVDALKTLVNAFGDYARAPVLQRQPLRLEALVGELVDLYAGDAGLQIGTALAADLPTLQVDAGRLRQVLHNLIKNAQEAAAGRGMVRIEIGARRVGDESGRAVELWVGDDGPGLPEGFDAGWFEPYRTTKAKGTGLGLAIVRKIAEEHGGSLAAGRSALGGAEFTLRLPL
jgi:nitrogen fixation/metabolism regulation signal transduction histidine kinase